MSLREKKKRQARDAMLKVAGDLINQQGFELTTMRDIAKAAEVSYQTLYNYFPTKAQIVQALLLEDIMEIITRVEQILDAYDYNCLESLNKMNRARVDIVVHRERDLWREVLIDFFKMDLSADSMYQITETAGHQTYARLLQLAQNTGELDPLVDCDVLAQILFSNSEYAFMRFIMDQQMSKTAVLKMLFEQTSVIIGPYLREVS